MNKTRQQRFALRIALFILQKNGFPQPKKKHVLNFVRDKRLLQFPEEELQKRRTSDHDEIWENDIAWKRKDLYLDGEIDDSEFGHWRLTNIGVKNIDRQKEKWLKLESPEEKRRVLSELDYWTEDLLLWMLKIARGDSLSLKKETPT